MFIYKIDILKELKSVGYSQDRLRKENILAQGTIQNIRNGNMVGIKSLDRICDILQCQPGMIIEHRNETTLKKV